jgi:hypothetical protein
MELERQYNKFCRKLDVPHGNEDCLMPCARWARAVLMVMEEFRTKVMLDRVFVEYVITWLWVRAGSH